MYGDGQLHWVDNHTQIPNYWLNNKPTLLWEIFPFVFIRWFLWFINCNNWCSFLKKRPPFSGTGNCTVMDDKENGLWSIRDCQAASAFACQKNPGECPPKWIPYRNRCYLVNSNTNSHASWYEAKSVCESYDATMIIIDK